jgi:hypothetical protein
MAGPLGPDLGPGGARRGTAVALLLARRRRSLEEEKAGRRWVGGGGTSAGQLQRSSGALRALLGPAGPVRAWSAS